MRNREWQWQQDRHTSDTRDGCRRSDVAPGRAKGPEADDGNRRDNRQHPRIEPATGNKADQGNGNDGDREQELRCRKSLQRRSEPIARLIPFVRCHRQIALGLPEIASAFQAV
jgi:hypothetical protein